MDWCITRQELEVLAKIIVEGDGDLDAHIHYLHQDCEHARSLGAKGILEVVSDTGDFEHYRVTPQAMERLLGKPV